MATLSVWKFDSPDGARQALDKLMELSKQQLITIQDAAYVTWPVGASKPKTQQAQSMGAAGALGGAFWGMLFGLLFFMPLLGMAIGAAIGGMMGHFTDVGINDEFINQVRAKVTEGTSALFLMSENATIDKVREAFAGTKMELIQTNLSAEQEAQLRAAFGEEEVPASPAAPADQAPSA
jgi:uncharacterized membrane protein